LEKATYDRGLPTPPRATIYDRRHPGADRRLIKDWLIDGAADGFNIMPPLLPMMLDVFCSEVIPLLLRRGLFRTVHEGETLRDHNGLG
jgi:hypothetical protein